MKNRNPNFYSNRSFGLVLENLSAGLIYLFFRVEFWRNFPLIRSDENVWHPAWPYSSRIQSLARLLNPSKSSARSVTSFFFFENFVWTSMSSSPSSLIASKRSRWTEFWGSLEVTGGRSWVIWTTGSEISFWEPEFLDRGPSWVKTEELEVDVFSLFRIQKFISFVLI